MVPEFRFLLSGWKLVFVVKASFRLILKINVFCVRHLVVAIAVHRETKGWLPEVRAFVPDDKLRGIRRNRLMADS